MQVRRTWVGEEGQTEPSSDKGGRNQVIGSNKEEEKQNKRWGGVLDER